MNIEKKKMRLLYTKWNKFITCKLIKSQRNYFRRICRYSDTTYKKHLTLSKGAKNYKELYITIAIMREELRVMHKDGVFYRHNVDFIKECAEIIKLDDYLGIEKTIAYAANIFTLKELEKIETWEMFDEMIDEKIEKGILKRVE